MSRGRGERRIQFHILLLTQQLKIQLYVFGNRTCSEFEGYSRASLAWGFLFNTQYNKGSCSEELKLIIVICYN